jgi:hypothetical protein
MRTVRQLALNFECAPQQHEVPADEGADGKRFPPIERLVRYTVSLQSWEHIVALNCGV